MKIKKLNESVIVEEIIDNPETVSTKDLVKEIKDGAAEVGAQLIDIPSAEQQAKDVKELSALLTNVTATADMTDVDKILSRALKTALSGKRASVDSAYPNVLLFGLPGFGKTAAVEQFVKKFGGKLNTMEVDAKTLDVATVGGIPYPVEDKATGELTQSPIAAKKYWAGLFQPNVILILDEINRAKSNVAGSLLTLINNHKLPWTGTDPVTGKPVNFKFFPNMLFTVGMINPASGHMFKVDRMDPALRRRFPLSWNVSANKTEFLNVLKNRIYGPILSIPTLSDEDRLMYERQLDIAEALLTSTAFKFENEAEVIAAFDQGREDSTEYSYLNYATFTAILFSSDGTKKDFLEAVKYGGFVKTTADRFEKGLKEKNYQDKKAASNNVMKKTSVEVAPEVQAQTSSDVAAVLGDFELGLDNDLGV